MKLPRRLKKELQKFLDQDNRRHKRTSIRLRRWFRQVATELHRKEVLRLILDRPITDEDVAVSLAVQQKMGQ